jgi:hypothetical protein
MALLLRGGIVGIGGVLSTVCALDGSDLNLHWDSADDVETVTCVQFLGVATIERSGTFLPVVVSPEIPIADTDDGSGGPCPLPYSDLHSAAAL